MAALMFVILISNFCIISGEESSYQMRGSRDLPSTNAVVKKGTLLFPMKRLLLIDDHILSQFPFHTHPTHLASTKISIHFVVYSSIST
jgi:hypothetical protein